jgi:phage repressor protein C with HTH and peptisase S24 domain
LPADALNFLRERLDEAIGGRRNAMSFAKLHPGATYRTLQSWIDGATWPDAAELLAIAEATGRPISFFLPAEAPPPEPPLVKIPVLDVSAAAGAGRAADVVRAVGELALPREFVRTFARPDADLSCLRCAGDSMAPTIQDNAMLIIDERQKVPRRWRAPARKAPRERQKPDEIFVFNQSGDLRLKRLRDLGDDFLLIWSDNHIEHPPEVFRRGRDGGLSIIGKVIWWDNRL